VSDGVSILFYCNIVLSTQRDVLYQNLRLAELITKLLGFEGNGYWRTGSRFKCHTGHVRTSRP